MYTNPGRGDGRAERASNGVRVPGTARHHLFFAPTYRAVCPPRGPHILLCPPGTRSSTLRPPAAAPPPTRPFTQGLRLRSVQKALSKTALWGRILVPGPDCLPLTQAPT